jgi:hypothetical protein
MLQPCVPQQSIVALLVEVKLPSMAETWINLAKLVNVRRHHPAARIVVQIENCTLPNIDKETNVNLAPSKC